MIALLTSYAYLKGWERAMPLLRERQVPTLLDSGGFTMWSKGKAVDLDAYCRFVETTMGTFTAGYFVLDLPGDPGVTAANEETMRARGLRPIPIFTRGASLDSLRAALGRAPLVAVGNMVGTRNPAGFAKLATEVAGPNRLHLLGLTGPRELYHLRPHSADSSNWTSGGRWDKLYLWTGRGMQTVSSDQVRRGQLSTAMRWALDCYQAPIGPRFVGLRLVEQVSRRSALAYAAWCWSFGVRLCQVVTNEAFIKGFLREADALEAGEWVIP